MPVFVSNTAVSTTGSTAPQFFDPRVLDILDMYPAMYDFDTFYKNVSLYKFALPEYSRIFAAQIFRACAKIFSGMRLESDSNSTLVGDMYFSQLVMICHVMELWMIDNRTSATATSASNGGVSIDMSAPSSTALSDIQSWNLFQNFFLDIPFVTPFDLNTKLFSLLDGILFNVSRR